MPAEIAKAEAEKKIAPSAAAAVVTEGEGAGADTEGDGEDEGGEPSGEAKTPPPAWLTKQLAKTRAKLAEEKTERARLAEELRVMKGRAGTAAERPTDAAEIKTTAAQIEEIKAAAAAEARAQVEAEQAAKKGFEDFDKACSDMVDEGHKVYGADWDKAVANFSSLGGIIEYSRETGLLDAVIASDDPAKALYLLGLDLDKVEEVVELPTWRRVAMINKLLKTKPKKQTSAPEPIDPLKGGSITPEPLSPKSNIKDWMKARNEQVSKGGRVRLMPR